MSRFTKIPDKIIKSDTLSANDFRVYCFLATFNPCFPSIPHIAESLKISDRTVDRCLKKLRNLKLLSSVRTGRSNQYSLTESVTKRPSRYDTGDVSDTTPVAHLIRRNDPPNNTKIKRLTNNTASSREPASAGYAPTGVKTVTEALVQRFKDASSEINTSAMEIVLVRHTDKPTDWVIDEFGKFLLWRMDRGMEPKRLAHPFDKWLARSWQIRKETKQPAEVVQITSWPKRYETP